MNMLRFRTEAGVALHTTTVVRHLLTAFLAVFLLASARGLPAPSASQQFQSLQAEMRQAHQRGDWQAFHASALKMFHFLNGSPDVLLDLARADAHLGEQAGAVQELTRYAKMGQSNEIVKMLPEFAALRQRPDFNELLDRMTSNGRPVSHAAQAFLIPDAGLVPEDIDYDPHGRRFFLTSVLERKIVTIDSQGHLADFAKAPDGWPMLALRVDARRRIVWATEVAMAGFSIVPKADWGRSALLGYSLDDGRLLRRIEGPQHSALGNMALAANGDLLIADGSGGGVYREHHDSAGLERIDHGDFISPQTPAYTSDGEKAFVPDYVRGIGVLDLATGQVRWLPMENKYALEGIDGLYLHRGSLIAVENGTTPERVMAFKLTSTLARVASEQVIESATPTIDPTHGVMVGDELYYIANSGWNELDDGGKVKAGAVLAPAHIMGAHLAN